MKIRLFYRRSNFARRALCSSVILIASAMLLSGCGKSMSGKYGNDMMQVEFKSSSKAYVSLGVEGLSRTTTEVGYEISGDKITLHNQAGNLILTVNKDGTLSGAPMEALSGPLKKL
jgi:hypothetical protein